MISVPFSGRMVSQFRPSEHTHTFSELEKKVEIKDSKRPAGPGGLVRVYGTSSENVTDEKSNDDFIPYCNLSHAQLSFHGHKDSVKFFLGVPGASKNGEDESVEVTLRRMLIMSGGDGYIDFRIGN